MKTSKKHTELPSGWEIQHFEDITEIDKVSLSSSTPKNYEFNYISLSDVDSVDFKIETTSQIFETAPSRARRVVQKGDILMSTVRPNLHGFSYIKNDVADLIASTGFAVLTPKKCVGEYLFQYLFSEGISKQFYQLLVGSNYPAINSSDVRRLKIPLPPLPEQRAIANILSTWDTSIQTTQALISQKEQEKKWLMQNLLTGKKRLKGFSREWKDVKIGDVTTKFSRKNKDLIDCRVYSVTNYNGFVLQSDHFSREVAGDNLTGYKIIKKGEFAYNPARINVGSIAYFNDEIGIISSLYVCFSTNEEILDYFLEQIFKLDLVKHRIEAFGEGGVRVYLWYELFEKIKISIPTIEEQTAIAQILQSAENEIELLKTKLEQQKLQKKGLMQVLLTGKVRVNTKNFS